MLTKTINNWQDLAAIPEQFAIENNHWIFRGVESADYDLVPKIGRRRARVDHNGDPVGYSPEAEQTTIERFKREARPHISIEPASHLEWLSIAQHHGLPTRLLDWTESPLIAAFFALRGGGFIGKDKADPAIYGLAPIPIINAEEYDNWVNSSIETPVDVVAYYPRHVTPRITAQRGLFTCHRFPDQPYKSKTLIKWVISNELEKNLCMRMKVFLNKCGLNDATMFPGLDGIAEHVEWLHKWQLV